MRWIKKSFKILPKITIRAETKLLIRKKKMLYLNPFFYTVSKNKHECKKSMSWKKTQITKSNIQTLFCLFLCRVQGKLKEKQNYLFIHLKKVEELIILSICRIPNFCIAFGLKNSLKNFTDYLKNEGPPKE